jgi:LCP family protein required for cell wall assembly
LALNIMLVMVCVTSAYALAFYDRQFADIPRIPLESSLTKVENTSTDPQNFLIVGADNAEGLDATDSVVNGRNIQEMLTDTIMILRIDPNQEKAWLLSLPRDLYVPIAGNHGKDRTNPALALGGPKLLIETIKQNFGIEIQHFMPVNFFGFKRLVDTIEGVNVYFNYPARDSNTGLDIPDVGCHTLTGDMALAFARSRHYTALIDGRWQEDVTSDHGRIARQQYFIKQALKKAISKGARNPIQLNNLIGVAKDYITIDDALTPEQILDLGARFNNFNPDDLEVFEPYTRGGMAGAASVLFLEEQPTQAMFNIFRGVDPTRNVLAAVRTEVRNGTGKVGEGENAADELRRRGFTVTKVTDDKDFRNEKTVIKHAPGPGHLLAAIVLARYFDADVPLAEDPTLAGSETSVALVVGRDFAGIRKDPRPLEEFAHLLPAPTDPEAPTSETTVAPATTAPVTTAKPGATTTTTAPPPSPNAKSIVPEPPEGVEC